MIQIITIILIALTNYQLAKFVQKIILDFFPLSSYQLALSIPWIAIGIIPFIILKSNSGLVLIKKPLKQNWKSLLWLCGLIILGLTLFSTLEITKYFHSVKYPLIFFLVTPLVEELVFRGWIFNQLKKYNLYPVLISSVLFGLHHLQYFNYIPTAFALFQITYTFFLGLILGKLRSKSQSIYLPLIMHVLINWVTINF